MISLSYFVTRRDFVIEVNLHDTAEAGLFDLIDDLRVTKAPDQSYEQHVEAAVAAVAVLAEKHNVSPLNIAYDEQGEADENELFGAH